MRFVQRTVAIVLLLCCAVMVLILSQRTHRASLLAPHSRSGVALNSGALGARAAPKAGALGAGSSAGAGPGAEDTGQGESATLPVPQVVPDVRVPDLSGTLRSVRDFLGHPLIINFWATWCEPCRREMPMLQALQTRYRGQALQVLGIAVDTRGAVQQFLHAKPIDYPVLVGEAEGTAAMDRFGAQPALPVSVFADAKGRIIVVKIGELHREEADYILAAERQVAQGRETLPQAREAIATQLRELAIERAKAESSGSGASS